MVEIRRKECETYGDELGMRAVSVRYFLTATVAAVVAFGVGVAAYVLIGIAMARAEPMASAAHHRVSIQPVMCDCIVKFELQQPLAGSGTVDNAYVAFNAQLTFVVGAMGVGQIIIEDQNGNVLYTLDKTVARYEEYVVNVRLLDGLGSYELSASLNGLKHFGPDGPVSMFIDYRALPLPPNTGGTGYVRIGGYVVPALGVLMSGLLSGGATFGIFVMVAVGRRRREALMMARDAKVERALRRDFSLGAIDRSGVVAKRRVTGRSGTAKRRRR